MATPAPAATTEGPVAYGAAALVRGTESCTGEDIQIPTPDPSGITHVRDFHLTCTVRFNDPRVSGMKSGPSTMDAWANGNQPDAIVQWGSSRRLENADGAWTGRFSGIYTTKTGDLISSWWEGTGAYAGLSFFEWIEIPPGAITTGYSVLGLIFPGSPPDVDDPGPLPPLAAAATLPPFPAPSSTPIAYGTGPGMALLVEGTESCGVSGIDTASPDADGVIRVRDAAVPCVVEFNDTRVSGTISGPWNVDAWGGSTGALVEWGTPRRIENTGGAWVGSFSGVHTSETGDMLSAWFTGTGGYAGLSLFEWIAAAAREGTSGLPVVGFIFPGSVPKT